MRAFAVAAAVLIVTTCALFGAPLPAVSAAPPEATADAPVLVLLDTSGSMADSDSAGVHKLDSAKRSVLGIVQELSSNATVGVWTYPGSSCSGGGFLPGLDMRQLDAGLRTRLTADVLALRADGSTPTGPALRAAAMR